MTLCRSTSIFPLIQPKTRATVRDLRYTSIKVLFQSGETVRQGQPVDQFFMIARGEIDIVLDSPGCPEMVLACLGPGQFFGEVELLHSGNSIASVRAAPTGPVELSLLSKNGFQRLLGGSPPTQEMIAQVARKRLAENRALNGSCEE